MEKITFYFVVEENEKYNDPLWIGRNGNYLRDEDFDWYGIKEYGFIDIAKATRYKRTRDWADYSVKELSIIFNTKQDKANFVDRFIRLYRTEKEYKIIMEELL